MRVEFGNFAGRELFVDIVYDEIEDWEICEYLDIIFKDEVGDEVFETVKYDMAYDKAEEQYDEEYRF